MKNKVFSFLALSFLCSAASVSSIVLSRNLASQKVEAQSYVESAIVAEQWQKTGGGNYEVSGGTILASDNTSKNENFFLNNVYDARGSYTISINATGTESLPVSKTMDVGIVPWYVDNGNYILIYLNWDKGDRPQDLREIQITGKLNGSTLIRTDNNQTVYQQNEWCDIYTDGLALEPTSSINFSVAKNRDKTNNTDSFVVTLNGTVMGSVNVRDIAKFDNKVARCGIYAYNDEFTFNSFEFNQVNSTGLYNNVANGIGKTFNDSLQYDNENERFSFETIDSQGDFDNVYIETNDNLGYAISYDIDLQHVSNSYFFGILANYEDEYNYLIAGIRVNNSSVEAGFKGVNKGLLKPTLNPKVIDSFKSINIALSSPLNLKVQKEGSLYKIYLNDIEVNSQSFSDYFEAGKVGFVVQGIDGVISSFENVSYFNEYSWEKKTFLSTSMNVSTRLSDSLTYSHGSFIFNENCISEGNTDKFARIYYPSSYYGNVSLTCTFNKVTSSSRFGLIPYLSTIDDYISASIVNDKLYVVHHQTSDDNVKIFDITSTLSETPSKVTLNVSLKNGLLSVSLGETTLVQDVSIEDITYDELNKYNIGLLAGGTTLEASAIGATGFMPLDPIDDHDFTFFGQRPSSWNYDYENQIISNTLINGVSNGWKATNALYKNEDKIKDLYIASKMQVTKAEGNEFKIGLMPYYKDADNHVIVWLSQWAGSGVKVVMTGRLDGHSVGGEWRESGDTGLNLFDANYLEVYLKGDDVALYLNKSFEPIFKTTFNGLTNRNMQDSFTGFQVGNGMQGTFSEFTMISETRIYTYSEKPNIIETGNRPTQGYVGTTIKLPIYTASNSTGDVLNPLVKVFDPNGSEVSLSKNSFIPSMVGNYKVSVVVEDNWGNVNDPYEYDINVIEKEEEKEEDKPQTNSLQPYQVGLIIGGGTLGTGLIAVGAIILVKKIKH